MAMNVRKGPIDPNLSLRLEVSMLRRGLTMTSLAKRIDRTTSAVSHWLSKRGMPPADVLPVLCAELHVSADWLLGASVSEESLELERVVLRMIQGSDGKLFDLFRSMTIEEMVDVLSAYLAKRDQ